MRPPRSRGFNLLEMAVVLAIIGVLVSVALPSWRSAQLQQVENEARTVLERLDLKQKLHWQRYARYALEAELPPLAPCLKGRCEYQLSVELTPGAIVSVC